MYEDYFDENIDQGLLDYVRHAEGFFSETLATPSGTPIIPVDARLVPENMFGASIIVKYVLASDYSRVGYAFFIPKGSDPELEALHQKHTGGLH